MAPNPPARCGCALWKGWGSKGSKLKRNGPFFHARCESDWLDGGVFWTMGMIGEVSRRALRARLASLYSMCTSVGKDREGQGITCIVRWNLRPVIFGVDSAVGYPEMLRVPNKLVQQNSAQFSASQMLLPSRGQAVLSYLGQSNLRGFKNAIKVCVIWIKSPGEHRERKRHIT